MDVGEGNLNQLFKKVSGREGSKGKKLKRANELYLQLEFHKDSTRAGNKKIFSVLNNISVKNSNAKSYYRNFTQISGGSSFVGLQQSMTVDHRPENKRTSIALAADNKGDGDSEGEISVDHQVLLAAGDPKLRKNWTKSKTDLDQIPLRNRRETMCAENWDPKILEPRAEDVRTLETQLS